MKNELNTKVMRALYSLIIWISLMVLCAECDSLMLFIVGKSVAFLLLVISARLLEKTLTKEDLDEKA